MKVINGYANFLLEKQFDDIISEIFTIFESESRTFEWEFDTESPTFEWDVVKNTTNKTLEKLKNFLEGLSKEKIREYFIKLMNKLKLLGSSQRRGAIIAFTSVFLLFCSLNYLIEPQSPSTTREEILTIDNEIKREIVNLSEEIEKKSPSSSQEVKTGGSSFEEAQKFVHTAEAGYSDDRDDTGNWINIPGFGDRFVGTNHGISAPVLAEYLGRLPKKEDMKNLSYETAVKIFRKNYWNQQNLSLLKNQSLATLLYDGCVNQGVGAMSKILRNALEDFGVDIGENENPFSQNWIKVINGLDQNRLHKLIKIGRLHKYRQSETYSSHGRGWEDRLAKLQFTSPENVT